MSIATAIGATAVTAGLTYFKQKNERGFIDNYVSNSNYNALTNKKIIAPCVLVEHHIDQYVITDHPTEFGVNISDHMYALPRRVDIEICYSLSQSTSALDALASTLTFGQYSPDSGKISLRDYYDLFLKLQAKKSPFTIITGKRTEYDMVIENIEETTDAETENILQLRLNCREVMIVYTSTTINGANMKDSANNAPPNNEGPKTYAAAPDAPITATPI